MILIGATHCCATLEYQKRGTPPESIPMKSPKRIIATVRFCFVVFLFVFVLLPTDSGTAPDCVLPSAPFPSFWLPLQPLDQIYSYQNLPYYFTSFFDFSSNSKGRPPGRPHITLYISICFTSHYLFLCEQIITHNNILYNFGIFAPLISISAD